MLANAKVEPDVMDEDDIADEELPMSWFDREEIERFFITNKILVGSALHLVIVLVSVLYVTEANKDTHTTSEDPPQFFYVLMLISWLVFLVPSLVQLLEYFSDALLVSMRFKTLCIAGSLLCFCLAYSCLLYQHTHGTEKEHIVAFLICVPYLLSVAFFTDLPRSDINIVNEVVAIGCVVVIAVATQQKYYSSSSLGIGIVLATACLVVQLVHSRLMSKKIQNVRELKREHKRVQNKESWLANIHSSLVVAKSSLEEQVKKKDTQLSTLRLTIVRQGKKLQHYHTMMAIAEQHSLVEQKVIVQVKTQLNPMDVRSMDHCTIDFDDIFIQKRLGPYSSYELYEAIFHGTPAAMKRIPTEKISEARVQQTVKEVILYGSLCHPRIAQFHGVAWSPFICLLFEFMNRGSLRYQLSRDDIKMLWRPHKVSIINDIALGMAYLHSRSPPIVHHNLTTDNCLMNSQFVTKISNVVCGSLTPHQSRKKDYHSAREVWENEPLDSAVDVYSFGVLLTEIDSQVPAPTSLKGRHTYEPSDECPVEVNSLLQRCIKQDKAERPTFAEISKLLEDLLRG
jgi:serine/threonine protein kinase